MKRTAVLSLCVSLLLLALGGSVALAAGKTEASRTVVIAEWGGALGDALKAAYYVPFEQETGIKVIQASGPDPSKVKAMVDSGNVEWDVFEGSMMEILNLGEERFEPIDYSQFDQESLENIPDEFRHKVAVGSFVWSNALAYSTEAFPPGKEPRGWVDFWNVTKFPGPRTLESGSAGDPPPLEIGLMGAGVPMDAVYPIDAERAFKSLDVIKPHVVKWWTGGAQPGQMLVDGEVVMAQAFSGRILSLQLSGAPVAVTYNQALVSMDMWLVPKNAPNKENAMKLIAFMSKAKPQAEFAKQIPYGPINLKAFDYIPEDIGKLLPSHPDNLAVQLPLNHKYWGANRDRLNEMWVKWAIE